MWSLMSSPTFDKKENDESAVATSERLHGTYWHHPVWYTWSISFLCVASISNVFLHLSTDVWWYTFNHHPMYERLGESKLCTFDYRTTVSYLWEQIFVFLFLNRRLYLKNFAILFFQFLKIKDKKNMIKNFLCDSFFAFGMIPQNLAKISFFQKNYVIKVWLQTHTIPQ